MATRAIVLCTTLAAASAFTSFHQRTCVAGSRGLQGAGSSLDRRDVGKRIVLVGATFSLPDWLNRRSVSGAPASAEGTGGKSNEVIRTVAGIRHRRLGGGDIVVSELGLGTQRWGGADFNSPEESLCHQMLDVATASGINLVDTAEQYPIPSDSSRPEGRTEEIIGNWMAKDKSRRQKLVIATKITGGRNITPKNLVKDCEGSLRRLKTDYIDIYNLHWPSRYTPQSNWGQSLEYNHGDAL